MGNEFKDPGFGYEILDDRSFKLKLFIINGDNKITRIRKGGIKELVIEDDILDFYHKGTLTMSNPHDVLERSTKQSGAHGTTIDLETFRFRSDARDFLMVEIEPLLDADVANAEDVDNSIYTMRFLFAIYAIEDVGGTSAENKVKKL